MMSVAVMGKEGKKQSVCRDISVQDVRKIGCLRVSKDVNVEVEYRKL